MIARNMVKENNQKSAKLRNLLTIQFLFFQAVRERALVAAVFMFELIPDF